MRAQPGGHLVYVVGAALSIFAVPAFPQAPMEETLSGPYTHETSPGARTYLLGDSASHTILCQRWRKLT
jgi:hypothetical protein